MEPPFGMGWGGVTTKQLFYQLRAAEHLIARTHMHKHNKATALKDVEIVTWPAGSELGPLGPEGLDTIRPTTQPCDDFVLR